jgi:hypothetical protein
MGPMGVPTTPRAARPRYGDHFGISLNQGNAEISSTPPPCPLLWAHVACSATGTVTLTPRSVWLTVQLSLSA